MTDSLESPTASESFEAIQVQARPKLFHVVWRHKRLLLLGVVVGCLMGSLYYARATPIYQSSAQVLVVKKTPEALPLPGSETRPTYTDDYLSTHQTLIRSPVIVGDAVKKSNLGSLPSFAGRGDPTGEIIGSLKVSRETNAGNLTSILNISVRGSHAEDTAAIVTAVIESYQRFLSAKYKSVADETGKLIVQANDILEKKLTAKQNEYDNFIVTHPASLKSKDGLSVPQERLLSLEAKRSALLLQEAEVRGRIAALEMALKEGRYSRAELLAMIAQAPRRTGGEGTTATMSMEDRLMTLELQEKTLSQDNGYGPDHPQLRGPRSTGHAAFAAEEPGGGHAG